MMRQTGDSRRTRILKYALMSTLFVVTFAIMTWGGVQHEIHFGKRMVGREIPELFPVLVISPKASAFQARVVLQPDLQNYIHGLSSYSFVVPQGMTVELSKQAQEDGFEVRTLPGERQYLKVTAKRFHRIVTGWYVAEPGAFIPIYYQSRFPPKVAAVFWAPFTFMTNVFLWLVGRFAYRRIRRVRVA